MSRGTVCHLWLYSSTTEETAHVVSLALRGGILWRLNVGGASDPVPEGERQAEAMSRTGWPITLQNYANSSLLTLSKVC